MALLNPDGTVGVELTGFESAAQFVSSDGSSTVADQADASALFVAQKALSRL